MTALPKGRLESELNVIGNPFCQRDLGSALANRLPKDDVRRRWLDYEAAYIRYNEMTFLFRNSTDSLKPLRFRGKNHLLKAMDNYVTPSFLRMDRCLTLSYSDWTRMRRLKIIAAELACGKYVDGKPWTLQTENGVLRGCLQTYQKMIEDFIWLKDRINTDALTLDIIKKYESTERCERGNFTCNYVKAWSGAAGKIDEGCKVLDQRNYQPPSSAPLS